MIKLKYGNTNTFFINGLLVDTDYAGSLQAFFRAIKSTGISTGDIRYVMATHYHPDHMGIIGDLCAMGIRLLLLDVQKDYVHFSDQIFARDGILFVPPDEAAALVISCEESRAFLERLGISGEIMHTPSHSPDSVSLILDSGDCIVGDMEPSEYADAYPDGEALKKDWERLMALSPKRILYAHRPEQVLIKAVAR